MRAHCQACEDREAELAYLRSELAIIEDMDVTRRLRKALNLHGLTEARILQHFMRCRHHTATRLQLAEGLNGGEDVDPKAVDVYLSRLRQALGRDAFESIWGRGWRMTPNTVVRLQRLVKMDETSSEQDDGDRQHDGHGGDDGPGRGAAAASRLTPARRRTRRTAV